MKDIEMIYLEQIKLFLKVKRTNGKSGTGGRLAAKCSAVPCNGSSRLRN